jgi:hypothetical protein
MGFELFDGDARVVCVVDGRGEYMLRHECCFAFSFHIPSAAAVSIIVVVVDSCLLPIAHMLSDLNLSCILLLLAPLSTQL